jgi:hypothetical protein
MPQHWSEPEEKALALLYPRLTIRELRQIFSKSEESINTKVRRMKQDGLIKTNKLPSTVERAIRQRRHDLAAKGSEYKWLWSPLQVKALTILYRSMTNKELGSVFGPEFTIRQIKNELSRLKLSGKVKKPRYDKTRTRAIGQRVWSKQTEPKVLDVSRDSLMDKECKVRNELKRLLAAFDGKKKGEN